MTAALYVQSNGCYFGLEGVEPWDKTRDARKYSGPWPVVAHPPCERWGRYWSGGPSARVRRLKGDDDGCFKAALEAVRRWSGVLEHPEASHAWSHFGLNAPPRNGGWIAGFRGRLDLLCRAGPLRPQSSQGDLALCPRRTTAGAQVGLVRHQDASG